MVECLAACHLQLPLNQSGIYQTKCIDAPGMYSHACIVSANSVNHPDCFAWTQLSMSAAQGIPWTDCSNRFHAVCCLHQRQPVDLAMCACKTLGKYTWHHGKSAQRCTGARRSSGFHRCPSVCPLHHQFVVGVRVSVANEWDSPPYRVPILSAASLTVDLV